MNQNGRRAGQLMIANAQRKHGLDIHAKEEQDFCEGIQAMVDLAQTQPYFEHIGDYTTKICELAYTHQVKLDPAYFRVAMALKVVEGISLSLDKDIDMVGKCIPIIAQTEAMRKLGILKFPMPATAKY